MCDLSILGVLFALIVGLLCGKKMLEEESQAGNAKNFDSSSISYGASSSGANSGGISMKF